MQIAVAAGKGGTGKTTVAVSLALAAVAEGRRVRLMDCDVEAPNAHLLLPVDIQRSETVTLPVPRIDAAACTGCGRCAELCAFNAVMCTGTKAFVFADLCHGCGGCRWVCPEKAVTETTRDIGVYEEGTAAGMAFAQGRLRIGEPMSPPLIRRVKASAGDEEMILCDAPPGTSCPAVSAANGCDVIVLVAEPTPFGLNDLALAMRMLDVFSVPVGVIVNRADDEADTVQRLCDREHVPVLGVIPADRRIAEAYSRGVPAFEALPELRDVFHGLLNRIEALGAVEVGA